MQLIHRTLTKAFEHFDIFRRNRHHVARRFVPRSLRVEGLEARVVLSGTPLVDGGDDSTGAYVTPEAEAEPAQDLVQFAKDLTVAGVKYYGAVWCSSCAAQTALFEDGAEYLPFIDVTNPDRTQNQIAIDEGITGYPTWIFPDGTRAEGVTGLATIAQRAGVPMPTGEEPSFAPIDGQTLGLGAPIHLGIDGYDPDGGPLTYTVTVDDPSLITEAAVLSGNRSLKIRNVDYGTMVFELFEGRAGRATDRIIQLAQDGFYDGITFHRVIDNFMVQGGDPTGTGSGGSTLGDFDDQFNLDLQHTTAGTLSMAKSGDDTNDSQFFITDAATRWLDFQHTVFGKMTEGWNVLESISEVPVDAQDKPDFTIAMTEVTVFDDVENAVVMLKAPEGGATGTTDVTITATDQDGNSYSQTFLVTVGADTENGAPFLADLQDLYTTTVGTPLDIQLEAFDVEGDAVYFDGATSNDYTIDNTTGLVNVPAAAVGTFNVSLGVRAEDGSSDWDEQQFQVTVAPTVPTGIDLLPATDSGVADDDDVTNANSLDFLITGVTDGAVVTLYAGSSVVGTATAAGDSVTISTANIAVLGDGTYDVTATQTINDVEGDPSPALSLTYDTTPPAAMTSTAPGEAMPGELYQYNAENPEEAAPGVVYSLNAGPAGMTIDDPATGLVQWTPTTNQLGAQQFEIAVADLAGNETTQTADVVVGGAIPATDDAYDVDEDGILTVDVAGGLLANDGDADPAPLEAAGITGPSNGALVLNTDGSFTYTPEDDFFGEDSFTYRAQTDDRQSEPVTVTITVNPVNDAPDGVADEYVVGQNGTLDVAADAGVLANDTDHEDDTLSAGLDTDVSNGTLTFNADGSFTYQPDAGFVGNDTFTYTANDGTDDSAPTTVTIHVNNAPVAVDDGPLAAEEDTELVVDAVSGVLGNDSDTEDDALSAVLVTDAEHGTVTLAADGSFTYMPDADFFGTDTFTYAADDGYSNSAPATVSIEVAGSPDAPTAVDDTYQATEDTTLSIDVAAGVVANDFDVDDDGPTLTPTKLTGPAYGTLTFNADGSFEYTPDADFFGIDAFTYSINDGQFDSAAATVTIEVANTQDLPVAADDAYATDEDVPLTVLPADGVLDNDTDVDGEAITATLDVPPAHGNLTFNIDGSFTYVPVGDYFGSDTFTYRAGDGTDFSAPATVSITIEPINDAPDAVADGYTVAEDGTLVIDAAGGVLANDVDPDNDPIDLSAIRIGGPARGTLVLDDDGSFTYTPEADYNGTDSFVYLANDGELDSIEQTVTITVTPVNDPPTAVDDAFTVAMNSAGNLLNPLGNDSSAPDSGETLSITNVSDGSQGGTFTIVENGTKLDYTPVEGFWGTETFTYTVSDGNGGSVQAEGEVAVTESAPNSLGGFVFIDVNDDGIMDDGELPVSGSTITLTGVTADSTDVEATVTTGADGSYEFIDLARGTYEVAQTQPAALLDGRDTVGSTGGNVTNDYFYNVALASGQSGTGYNFGEIGLRPEMITLRMFLASSPPMNEQLPGLLLLGEEWFGDDDNNNNNGPAENTPPAVVDDAYTVAENQVLTVDATGGVLENDTDQDGDSLTVALGDAPEHGVLDLQGDGSFVFTPEQDFQGTDAFTYTADDGTDTSATATVTITVVSDNDPPDARNDAYTVDEDGVLDVEAGDGVLNNDSDDDEDVITAAWVDGPNWGTVSLDDDGSFVYTPVDDFHGTDTFTYVAKDPESSSTPTTVTITVLSENDAPVAADDAYTATENETLIVGQANGLLDNDSDVEDDTLSAIVVALPANGTLTLSANGSFEYAPDNGFSGIDTFTYKANDGLLDSNTATVAIDVGAVNNAPVAVADFATVGEDGVLNVIAADGVLDNDSDSDGDSLAVSLVDTVEHGTLVLNANGSYTYTPDADYSGPDSFRYKASDGIADSNTATVSITVEPVNDVPEAANDSFGGFTDTPLVVDAAGGLLANDTDVDGDPLSAVLVDGPDNGTLTLSADGSFEYTPDNGFSGFDSFTYTANDGTLDSAAATVSIEIQDNIPDTVTAIMMTYDLTGAPITSIGEGEQFLLKVFVKDISDNPQGIFSAYMDITYDSALATPDLSEVQSIELPVDADGGTFTLSLDGQTTADLVFDATADAVQSALEALSNVEPGEVVVSDTAAGWEVAFLGALANQDVSELVGDGSNLTDLFGSSLNNEPITVTEITSGRAIHFGSNFGNVQSGDVGTNGLIDEVGATFTGLTGPGGTATELFRIQFTAGSAGSLAFVADLPDILPAHDWLRFGPDDPVPAGEIALGRVTIEVTPAAQGEGEPMPMFSLPLAEGEPAAIDHIVAEWAQPIAEAIELPIDDWGVQTLDLEMVRDLIYSRLGNSPERENLLDMLFAMEDLLAI